MHFPFDYEISLAVSWSISLFFFFLGGGGSRGWDGTEFQGGQSTFHFNGTYEHSLSTKMPGSRNFLLSSQIASDLTLLLIARRAKCDKLQRIWTEVFLIRMSDKIIRRWWCVYSLSLQRCTGKGRPRFRKCPRTRLEPPSCNSRGKMQLSLKEQTSIKSRACE